MNRKMISKVLALLMYFLVVLNFSTTALAYDDSQNDGAADTSEEVSDASSSEDSTTDSSSDYIFTYNGKTYDLRSNDTFSDEKYNLNYLLNGYQVIAFDSGSSITMNIHCMGAILANGDVEIIGTGFADGSDLPESYIKGKLSGTGKYVSRDFNTASRNGSLYLGTVNDVKVVSLYGDSNNLHYEVNVEKKEHEGWSETISGWQSEYNVLSPGIWLSDSYIDFDKLKSVVEQYSSSISAASTKTITSENGTYTVQAGDQVVIENIQNGTINIVGDETKSTIITVKGTDVSMPMMNINGSQPNVVEQSETGAGIVWNFPDAKKVEIPSQNWVGHVIAPNADVSQSSGNYNGTYVVNTFTTAAEGHTYFFSGEMGYVTLEGTKKLEGRELHSGEFKFVVKEGDNTVATGENDADGKITFSKIYYTKAGEHTYTISEQTGADSDITYDDSSFEVTVKVVSDGNGKLIATPTYPSNGVVFKNEYNEGKTKPIKLALSATKTLTGRALKDDEFFFSVKEGDKEVATGTNKADGTITFSEINYTQDDIGTHTYTVSEDEGNASGVTYDSTTFEVTVNVTDNGDGTLKTEATYPEGGVVFTNTYTTNKTTIVLEGTKSLTGRSLKAGEFNFVVKENNDTVATGTNAADGTIAFTPIEYTEIGEHTYTVSEVEGSLGGVTYDNTVFNVTVNVTDDGNGHLVAAATYPDVDVVFSNTYNAEKTSVTLAGTKALEGRDLKTGEFKFSVKENGTEVATGQNDATGNIAFDSIEYTETGIHYYTVTEVNNSLGGVTYDNTVFNVTVNVTDNGNGQLEATATYPNGRVAFTNTYKAEKTSIALKGTKTLNGRELSEGEFSFTVKEGDKVVATGTNAADGTIEFTPIEYTEIGEHTYTVTEDSGSLGGVSYDSSSFEVTVKVTDDGNGKLVAAATYPERGVVFTNIYTTAETNVSLEGTKSLTGRSLKDNEFRFTVKEGDKVVSTGSNDVNGKITFGVINYGKDDIGTHILTITEDSGSKGGVTYSKESYTVTVTVSDNGDGTLNAAIAEPEGGIVFHNGYAAAEVTATLGASKMYTGADLTANLFSFQLKDASGTVVDTAKNAADGNISFKELTFKKAGKYNYTVSEVNDGKSGVTYSEAVFNVKITVTDNGEGKLIATVDTEGKALTFTNKYDANGSITLEGKKTLEGKELKANEFRFTVKEGTKTVAAGKNDASGKISFDEIKYTLDDLGTHTYTVTEDNNNLGGVEYDTKSYEVTVVVTDNGDGTLKAEASYPDGAIEFKNKYTTTYASMTFRGTKNLEGRDMTAGEFKFSVKEDGKEIATGTNDADGNIVFPEIRYALSDIGNHVYTVSEVDTEAGGVTYDTNQYTVNVEVSDNGDGTLSSTATYPDNKSEVTFTNKYVAASTKISLEGDKSIEGRELKDGEFKFTITENGEVVATAYNDAEGNVKFPEIEFKKAGTHHYVVGEVDTEIGGVTYDRKTFEVTVEVTDNGKGQLVEKTTYPNGDISFFNTYTTESTSVTLKGTKEIAGRDLKAGEFNFSVKEGDKTVATGTNDAEGNISFTEIKYELSDVGTHTYTVSEDKESLGGVTYDENTFKVTVVVSDNGDGTLSTKVAYPENGVKFVNSYETNKVKVNLEAKKSLEGRDLKEGEFNFSVKEGDNVVATGTNDAEGKISFTEIEYKQTDAGTHKYTVTEDEGNLGGVAYDDSSFEVTVVVTDDGNGKLTAEAKYPEGGVTFSNKYITTPVKLTLEGTKSLEGRDLKAGEFNFSVKEDGKTVATGSNDANGKISFTEIEYKQSDIGTHNLVVTEDAGEKGGVEYSNESYAITVTVSDNGDGTLSAEAALPENGLVFHNKYAAAETTAVFGAKKTYTGANLKKNQFSFELKNADGEVIDTAKNDGDGNITFKEQAYTEAGEYTYTISEVVGNDKGVKYDETVYTVTVTVTDNEEGQLVASVDTDGKDLVFNNEYDPTTPKTGDDNNILGWMGAMVSSMMAFFAMTFRRKKKN